MRCPKCHYLSFEPESRCRNCGYEFAFAEEDLLIKESDEPEGPLTDIPLRPAAEATSTPITLGPIRPTNVRPKEVGQPSASAVGLVDQPEAKEPTTPRREVPRRPPPPRPAPPAAPLAVAPPVVQPPRPVVEKPVPSPVPPPAARSVVPSAAPVPAAPRPVAAPPAARPVVPPPVARPAAPPPMAKPVVPPPVAKPVVPPPVVKPVVPPPAAKPGPAPISVELPLFVQRAPTAPQAPATDEPEPSLAVPPAPPPLSVRRRTPDPARVQATYQREVPAAPPVRKPGPVERDLLEDLSRLESVAAPRVSSPPMVPSRSIEAREVLGEQVGASARAAAAGLDLLMLGGINVAIVWLTLRWCELTLGSIGVLPLLPLAAFLLLIDGGYLLLFTAANGQTVGKMATGIRVVDLDDERAPQRVTLGQAALRAICTIASVMPVGIGFFPALVGSGRAFHDRIAHTRVVRAA